MGNLIGNILNFLTSPIGFVIIFGLIGGLGKVASWFQQERARRAAIQARARRQTEELRMGRPVNVASQPAPMQSPVQAQPQTAADRQRALQEQRAAQLRALQQQRLAELRAKRAQAAGGRAAGGVATPPPTPSRTPTPQPVRSAQRPKAPRQPEREAPAPLPSARSPRPPQQRSVPTMSPGSFTPSAPQPEPMARPGMQASAAPASGARFAPGAGLGALLGTQADLRRAVILSEILGPPICDRDPEQSGSF